MGHVRSFVLSMLCACVSGSPWGGRVGRTGWLDRLVSLRRAQFEDDVRQLAPVQIQASVETAPAGYADSAAWDTASVSRLLRLLEVSDRAAPARRALAQALTPNTRRFISKNQSWKLFPSLGKSHLNDIYYDMSSSDESVDAAEGRGVGGRVRGDAVLVLRNPVEARLPSSRISVKLLRDILENRARAARRMPFTTLSTFPWKSMSKATTITTATDKCSTEQAPTETPGATVGDIAPGDTSPGDTGPGDKGSGEEGPQDKGSGDVGAEDVTTGAEVDVPSEGPPTEEGSAGEAE